MPRSGGPSPDMLLRHARHAGGHVQLPRRTRPSRPNHSILIGTEEFRTRPASSTPISCSLRPAIRRRTRWTHPAAPFRIPCSRQAGSCLERQSGITPCGSVVDSVAYGGYSGTQPPAFGTPDNEVIPTTDICDDPPDDPGSFACSLKFVSTLVCPPTQIGCPMSANNQTDYTVLQAAPCNNAAQCSASVALDSDGDGVPDVHRQLHIDAEPGPAGLRRGQRWGRV